MLHRIVHFRGKHATSKLHFDKPLIKNRFSAIIRTSANHGSCQKPKAEQFPALATVISSQGETALHSQTQLGVMFHVFWVSVCLWISRRS